MMCKSSLEIAFSNELVSVEMVKAAERADGRHSLGLGPGRGLQMKMWVTRRLCVCAWAWMVGTPTVTAGPPPPPETWCGQFDYAGGFANRSAMNISVTADTATIK